MGNWILTWQLLFWLMKCVFYFIVDILTWFNTWFISCYENQCSSKLKNQSLLFLAVLNSFNWPFPKKVNKILSAVIKRAYRFIISCSTLQTCYIRYLTLKTFTKSRALPWQLLFYRWLLHNEQKEEFENNLKEICPLN